MRKETTFTMTFPGEPSYGNPTGNSEMDRVLDVLEKNNVEFESDTKTFYKIGELPENIQEEIFDRKRDTNVFFDWWRWTIEGWKERLAKIGFDDADIRFSGFWSQGDGASFTAYCDSEKILNALLMCEGNIQNYKQWRLWFELIDAGIFKFDIARISSHYVHKNTVSGVIQDDFGGLNDKMWYAPDPNKPFTFTSIFEKKANLSYLEAMFDSFVKDLCRKIYSDLEEEYEYLTSNNCIKEYLENNDYEFDEYGNDIEE